MGGSVSSGANNDELIDNLIEGNRIRTALVEKVWRHVDRAFYFLPQDVRHAYKDSAWKRGNFHLSAPCIYSEVLENLDLKPGLSFLNIGSGTGYLSTMVGLILGSNGVNHGIELHEDVINYAYEKLELFKTTSDALDAFDFCEPVFVKGNGLNLNVTRQYDRVYCGSECPPQFQDFMKCLIKVGGILVMPYNDQLVRYYRVSKNEWKSRMLLLVSFAPLITPIPKEETDIINQPTVEPLSLQALCRSGIRNTLRKNLEKLHPEIMLSKEKVRQSLQKMKFEKDKQEEVNRLYICQLGKQNSSNETDDSPSRRANQRDNGQLETQNSMNAEEDPASRTSNHSENSSSLSSSDSDWHSNYSSESEDENHICYVVDNDWTNIISDSSNSDNSSNISNSNHSIEGIQSSSPDRNHMDVDLSSTNVVCNNDSSDSNANGVNNRSNIHNSNDSDKVKCNSNCDKEEVENTDRVPEFEDQIEEAKNIPRSHPENVGCCSSSIDTNVSDSNNHGNANNSNFSSNTECESNSDMEEAENNGRISDFEDKIEEIKNIFRFSHFANVLKKAKHIEKVNNESRISALDEIKDDLKKIKDYFEKIKRISGFSEEKTFDARSSAHPNLRRKFNALKSIGLFSDLDEMKKIKYDLRKIKNISEFPEFENMLEKLKNNLEKIKKFGRYSSLKNRTKKLQATKNNVKNRNKMDGCAPKNSVSMSFEVSIEDTENSAEIENLESMSVENCTEMDDENDPSPSVQTQKFSSLLEVAKKRLTDDVRSCGSKKYKRETPEVSPIEQSIEITTEHLPQSSKLPISPKTDFLKSSNGADFSAKPSNSSDSSNQSEYEKPTSSHRLRELLKQIIECLKEIEEQEEAAKLMEMEASIEEITYTKLMKEKVRSLPLPNALKCYLNYYREF